MFPLESRRGKDVYKRQVSVNRNSTNYEVDEVLCDGRKIASMALDHRISLGHKNSGYVCSCRNEERYMGCLLYTSRCV